MNCLEVVRLDGSKECFRQIGRFDICCKQWNRVGLDISGCEKIYVAQTCLCRYVEEVIKMDLSITIYIKTIPQWCDHLVVAAQHLYWTLHDRLHMSSI